MAGSKGDSAEEGRAWWLHVVQQRRAQRTRTEMPLHAISTTHTSTAEKQRKPLEAQKTAQPFIQQDDVAHPHPSPPPPNNAQRPQIKGWTPPPGRTACRLIAAQEMQAFYAQEYRHKHGSYLRLLRVPPTGHNNTPPHGGSTLAASMRRTKSLAASIRHGSKASGNRRHYTAAELQTLHWAQQHATEQMEQWLCAVGEAHVDGVEQGDVVGKEEDPGEHEGSSGGRVDEAVESDEDGCAADEDVHSLYTSRCGWGKEGQHIFSAWQCFAGGAVLRKRAGCTHTGSLHTHRQNAACSSQPQNVVVDTAARLHLLSTRIAAVRALHTM